MKTFVQNKKKFLPWVFVNKNLINNNEIFTLGLNISWNFLGKLFYAASRGVILIIIAKLGTSHMVGQFALALAITAPVFMLADLNLRSVFATDTKNQYDFQYYFALRILLSLLCIAVILSIIAVLGYDFDTAIIVFFIGLAKSYDALSDILYSVFQKNEKMDKLGKSLILKGIASCIAVYFFMLFTKSLVISVIGLSLSWLFVLISYDYVNATKLVKVRIVFNYLIFKELVRVSLPLGLVLLFTSLNSNICSYFIENLLGSNLLGYYASIYYITIVGDTMANALGQTASPRLASYYAGENRNKFLSIIIKLSSILIGISLIAVIFVAFLGDEMLTLLYKSDYAAYGDIFLLLMISGVFLYLSNFLSYSITAARLFKVQPYVSGIVLILSTVFNYILISRFGIKGAAYSSIMTSFLLVVGNMSILLYAFKKITISDEIQKSFGVRIDNAFKVTVISEIKQLSEYKDRWRCILKENNNNIVFLDPDWISRWWEVFGEDKTLHIITISKNNTIIGFCPLMIIKNGFIKEAIFVGFPQSTNMDLVVLKEYREETIREIALQLVSMKGNFIFSFSGFDSKSPNYDILSNYLKKGKYPKYSSNVISPVIKINEKNFESYYKTRFSTKSQKKIRNSEKRLRELADYQIKKIENKDIDIIFKLHAQRWKKKMDTSEFSSEKCKKFFSDLVCENTDTFKTEVRGLYLNNRIIAFQYGFIYNNQYLFYRSSHDDVFSKYGPGLILKKDRIKYCFDIDSNINLINFGIGYETYKKDWTDDNFEILSLIFSKKNFISHAVFLFKYLKYKFRDFLKKYRFIVLLKRNTLGKLKYSISIENIKNNYMKLMKLTTNKGIYGFLKEGLNNICTQFYFKSDYELLEKELLEQSQYEISTDYILKIAGIEDLYMLADFMNCSPEYVIDRFYKLHKCFIALSQNKIIHYSWVSFNDFIEIPHKVQIKIEECTGCVYETYATKDKNLNSSIFLFICNYLKENKMKKAIILLPRDSKSIINIAKLHGFVEAKIVRIIKTLNKCSTAELEV